MRENSHKKYIILTSETADTHSSGFRINNMANAFFPKEKYKSRKATEGR